MQRTWLVGVFLLGCGGSRPVPAPVPAPAPAPVANAADCLADRVGPLMFEVPSSACEDDNSCEQRCARDDRDACFARAIALEDAGNDEAATAKFARVCELGNSIGCTNVGAIGWMDRAKVSRACVDRLFVAACTAKDPWGCGMHGRFLSVAANTDPERADARAHFERVCTDLGGVTCRMYALHLEKGQLGEWTPELSKTLMQRACDTGDHEACGAESADATFD